jgi:peptide/nickel transport system ATP-binding protein
LLHNDPDGMTISVDNVTITFGSPGAEKAAVCNVSFAVEQGEAFGLVGESGSGKTTILRAIAGLPLALEGQILVEGERIERRRSPSMRKRVQMVFQDCFGSLHPNHTVDEILSEPVSIHKMGEQQKRTLSILNEVGLDSRYRFRYPHQLSGGQRQRIAIARALIVEPQILLLDEPTSALDVSIQAEILNLLSCLHARRGLTIIMVSHDLAVVAHTCSRIGVMNRGELIEIASRDNLASGMVQQDYTRELLESDRVLTGGFADQKIRASIARQGLSA